MHVTAGQGMAWRGKMRDAEQTRTHLRGPVEELSVVVAPQAAFHARHAPRAVPARRFIGFSVAETTCVVVVGVVERPFTDDKVSAPRTARGRATTATNERRLLLKADNRH